MATSQLTGRPSRFAARIISTLPGGRGTAEGARELHGQRADRVDTGARQRLRAPTQHVDETRLVERRIGIRRTGEAGDAAGERCIELRFEGRLVLEPRLAQACGKIDEPGCRDQAFGIYHALGARKFLGDLAVGEVQVALCVAPARRIDDARVLDDQTHQFPATMLITAMRTAMPNVTCGRITECGPSATDESSSTPRVVGPGRIPIAV